MTNIIIRAIEVSDWEALAALHLYEKFGFVIEGTLKKYAFRAGSYVDAYTMARIVSMPNAV